MHEPTTERTIERTRTLCHRCMMSFEYEGEASKGATLLCPSCRRQTAEATGRPCETAEASWDRGAPESFPVRTTSTPRTLIEDVKNWCVGRSCWVRLPLWAYLTYTIIRYFTGAESYRSIFDAVNLGIHELGHYLFSYFGQFLHVAGGTIAQCTAPVLSGVMFFRQRDYFAISVCLFWFGTNLAYVSVYMADARALRLPLVSPGMGVLPPGDGGVLHDWNHLLGITGLLPYDTALAAVVKVLAVALMVGGLSLGAWLMARMVRRA